MIKKKNMFKSKTIQVLTATGAILATIFSIGDQFGISAENLGYLEKGITFLGLMLGVKFRVDAESKPRLNARA